MTKAVELAKRQNVVSSPQCQVRKVRFTGSFALQKLAIDPIILYLVSVHTRDDACT